MEERVVHKLVNGTAMGLFRCGRCRGDAGSSHPDFITPQYAMNYVHEGEGVYTTADGQSYNLTRGSVLQRFPNSRHSVAFKTPALFLVVALPSQAWEMLQLTGLAGPERPVFQTEPDDTLKDRFDNLAESLAQCSDRGLTDVFMEMLGMMTELHSRAVEAPGQTMDRVIIQAMDRLATVNARTSIPDLAAELGMGYSNFRKRFKAQVGQSPGAFQMTRRIEVSLNLLSDSRRSISDIARELGYPDIYTFSTQFKRVMGFSPKEARRG
ncbi:MAG: AraC family transcriptional regulator [Planctomycetota bacterium]|jgi:AraC-like DNA-binding protein